MKIHTGTANKYPGAKQLRVAFKSAVDARGVEATQVFLAHVSHFCVLPSDYQLGVELIEETKKYAEKISNKNPDSRLIAILDLLTTHQEQLQSWLTEDERRMNAYLLEIRHSKES